MFIPLTILITPGKPKEDVVINTDNVNYVLQGEDPAHSIVSFLTPDDYIQVEESIEEIYTKLRKANSV